MRVNEGRKREKERIHKRRGREKSCQGRLIKIRRRE